MCVTRKPRPYSRRSCCATRSCSRQNYVVLEACALLQRRLGLTAVEDLVQKVLPVIRTHWMDAESHNLATATLLAARRRQLSLVDCSSFVAMRAEGCSTAFAFDAHFEQEGFQVLKAD